MKLIIAADIYPPDIGGPATYSKMLKEELPKHGITVDLVCYSDQSDHDVIRVVRSGPAPWRYFKYYRKLKEIAKDADVIYAMGPVSAGLPAMWAAKKLNKKLVVKVVGDYAWEQARNSGVTDIGIDEFQDRKFSGKIGKLQKIEREVCKAADKVITPSGYLANIVTGWGVDKKIEVIYNSCDEPDLSLRQKAKDKNVLVSVGRLVPWKGFETLIKLMPELREENPDLVLRIYGSGPLQESLETLISSLNLKNVVTIKHLPHKKLLEAMAGSGGLILNSGYEGLSHTILEAMSLGLPVAASKMGGNPNLLEKTSGHLFEYDNKKEIKEAIRKIQNDFDKADRRLDWDSFDGMFSSDTMLNKTVEVLKSV